MSKRIAYSLSLVVSLGLYAGTAVGMMSRTAQQATRKVTPTACRFATPRFRSNIPTDSSASRCFATQSTWTRPDASSVYGLSRRSMSTFSKSFEKLWPTGATPAQILGISEMASFKDAQKAYREIIQKVHPDKNLDNLAAATQATQEANDALTWFKKAPGDRSYSNYGDNRSYYAYYQKIGSKSLYALYALIMGGIGVKTAIEIKHVQAIKKLTRTIDQLNELYDEFEKLNVPELMAKQFTLELDALKSQVELAVNEARKSGSTQKMIDLLQSYTQLLNGMLVTKTRVLRAYAKNPDSVNILVNVYEKVSSEHKKIFENSARRTSLHDDIYNVPALDETFYQSLTTKFVDLKSEIDFEKAQQKAESKRAKQESAKQKSYLGAVKNWWSYYTQPTNDPVKKQKKLDLLLKEYEKSLDQYNKAFNYPPSEGSVTNLRNADPQEIQGYIDQLRKETYNKNRQRYGQAQALWTHYTGQPKK